MPARIFSILVLCLLGCVAIPDLAQEKSNEASIRALEVKWADAYRQRQVNVLSSLISDDYVITMEDGATLSKVGFISRTAQPSEHVDTAEIIDIKIRMHGDTAIVTGSYHESGESRGKRYDYHDRLTDVWMKIGGKWQLIASHYSLPASLY